MQCDPVFGAEIYLIGQDRCLDEPGFVRPVRQTIETVVRMTPGTRVKDTITIATPDEWIFTVAGELWIGWFVHGQRLGVYRIIAFTAYPHGLIDLVVDLSSNGQSPFTPGQIA